jgi:hypothetical protein
MENLSFILDVFEKQIDELVFSTCPSNSNNQSDLKINLIYQDDIELFWASYFSEQKIVITGFL